MKKVDNVSFGSRGFYSLQVIDCNGNVKENKNTLPTTNVVTYAGAFYSLISSSLFGNLYAALGTGTVERTKSSINLDNEDAGRSSNDTADRAGNEVDNGDGTSTLTLVRTMSFGLGAKVGTFSEVGLFSSSSGGTFIAGQLLKNDQGDPTTITLLSDEQLFVTYTLEWVVPNTSKLVGTGSVTDAASNTYSYEVWAQPYFYKYTVGNTDVDNRYFPLRGGFDNLVYTKADGTTKAGVGTQGVTWNNPTHDGAGNVTISTSDFTASPSDGTFTDVTFMGFVTDNPNFYYEIIDTVNVLVSSDLFRPTIVVKFLQPVTKTSDDSFSIRVSVDLVLS